MPNHRLLSQRLRPWAVWLALCVALVGALVPTISHAVAWSEGGAPGYGAICTTADTSKQPTNLPGSMAQSVHCAYCLFANDSCTLPPAQLTYLFLPQGQSREVAISDASDYAASLYRLAAPRGPPAPI